MPQSAKCCPQLKTVNATPAVQDVVFSTRFSAWPCIAALVYRAPVLFEGPTSSKIHGSRTAAGRSARLRRAVVFELCRRPPSSQASLQLYCLKVIAFCRVFVLGHIWRHLSNSCQRRFENRFVFRPQDLSQDATTRSNSSNLNKTLLMHRMPPRDSQASDNVSPSCNAVQLSLQRSQVAENAFLPPRARLHRSARIGGRETAFLTFEP